jgi:hypothetical protein
MFRRRAWKVGGMALAKNLMYLCAHSGASGGREPAALTKQPAHAGRSALTKSTDEDIDATHTLAAKQHTKGARKWQT